MKGYLWEQARNIEDAVDGQPDPEEAPRDMAADIDDLSRDYTEEIEAHRLTRERAEKAERQLAEEREWYAACQRRFLDASNEAEKAEARLAELVSELRAEIRSAPPFGMRHAVHKLIIKYEGGEHQDKAGLGPEDEYAEESRLERGAEEAYERRGSEEPDHG